MKHSILPCLLVFICLMSLGFAAQVNLAWDAVSVNDLAGYHVYRSEGTGSFVRKTAMALTVSQFTDTTLQSGIRYRFAVTAIDSAGLESPFSNIIELTPACSYSATPTTASFSASQGSGTITVSCGSGCGWSATTGAGWITISSGVAGTGPGTVNYAVAANSTSSTRMGSINIADKAVVVNQAAGSATDTPPTVAISAPASGATVSGVVNILVSASDAQDAAGTLQVAVSIDGVWKPATYSGGSYQASWDTKTVANGAHTLSARATDKASQTTTCATRSVNVSNSTSTPNTSPNVSISSPSGGATVSGIVNIVVNATDAEDAPGTLQVAVSIDGAWKTATYSGGSYVVSWDTKTVANGARVLAARATDSGSYSRSTETRTVNVNNSTTPPPDTPPTVSIASPANGATVSGVVNIMVSATDAQDAAGALTVAVSIDGIWKTAANTNGSYQVSWDTGTVANGAHTLVARATDSAAQTTTSAARTVNVNNTTTPSDTPPTVSIASPANGATVSGVVNIMVSASDKEDPAGSLAVSVSIAGVWRTATYSNGYYTVAWDTRTFDRIAFTLVARATDRAGHTTTGPAVTVRVKNSGRAPRDQTR